MPPSPHLILQPPGWPAPKGYSNGIAAEGRLVFVAGQIGWDENRSFPEDGFLGQVRKSLENVVAVLAEAGARPEHLVRMTWYVADMAEYNTVREELGGVYREVIGQHFPPMALIQVAALAEPKARVEIEATAVIPR